jgi:hypothetical protein
MMLLSRFWYVILSILVGLCLYVVFLAYGQYNRRLAFAQNEELASDSQVVGWALQIDARRRLDFMLFGSVDPGVRGALKQANGAEKVPPKARDEGRKALQGVAEKIPAEFRSDALFAVDRDGRVVASVGFDTKEEFELGGYAAVFDALHGYLRDDTWVLGGKIYRVVARPVEDDATQPPIGAVVGMKGVDPKFAQDLAKRTRTNIAFFANGTRVASAASQEGFEESQLELITPDLAKLPEDPKFKTGRSDLRPIGEKVSAIYARLVGESWDLGAGYAVVRTREAISGPMGFVTGADETDRKNAKIWLIVLCILAGSALGIGLSFLEHSMPLSELVKQAQKLRKGELDYLQVPRFRGAYRAIAQDVNSGIERVVEKGGGATRKPADLESILGPTPAQPAMSAFSFPMPGQEAPAAAVSRPGASGPRLPGPPPPGPGSRPHIAVPGAPPGPPPPGARPPVPAAGAPPGFSAPLGAPLQGTGATQPLAMQPTAPAPFPPPGPGGPSLQRPPTGGAPLDLSRPQGEEDEATVVGQAPAEVLAAAGSGDGSKEWLGVYDDFIRTKKECGESVEGLTFEKFQQTLKKNRDALMQRHGCKRVKFSVYVKEGRASLKATPVRE